MACHFCGCAVPTPVHVEGHRLGALDGQGRGGRAYADLPDLDPRLVDAAPNKATTGEASNG